MVRDALSSALPQPGRTPQTEPIPNRPGMVKNNAGGYVFGKNDWRKLEDFLILGTTGGTFYLGQDKLTMQNADVVMKLARENGAELVKRATAISTAIPARAPKNRGCVFGLAAVSALGDPEGVQAVKEWMPHVARTTNDLSMFFGYRKQLKGKATPRGTSIISSSAFRKTLAAWFFNGDVNDVAFKVCKGRQRKTPQGEAFTLRDVLRIARPSTDSTARKALFGWIAGNVSDQEAAQHLPAVHNFMLAQAVTTPAEAIRVVTERRVPWEFLPSGVLGDGAVWEALAGTIGMTALVRNLARMTRNGAIAPFSDTTKLVMQRLTNKEALAKGRIHPMDLYLALRVYASGTSQPNPKAPAETWSPVSGIMDALEEAYELSFSHVQPTGRKLLIAVDSSGSMGYGQVTMNGSKLGLSYQVANSIALTMKRIEGEDVHVIDVDTTVHDSKITRRSRLAEVQRGNPSGGGTDLSLPFAWAHQHNLKVDGFMVITDNETWAGRYQHPVQAFESYRTYHNPQARNINVAMTPGGFSIADPQDKATLQLAGMDASLPQVALGFIRGDG